MTKKIFDHKNIEEKWQKKWSEEKLYSEDDMSSAQKKFYNLMMFPYPSAEGLHAGNMYAFTGSDVMGRFKRMQGFQVFEPIGLDGFGIHAENYAMKIGRNPIENAKITEANYYKQLHMIGNGFDWDRTVETYKPEFYKWTQWVFVQLFKAGLAYRKKSPVNWCPGCKTVLADEQIMTPAQAGKIPPGFNTFEEIPEGIKVCERCGNIPEIKDLEQWFCRITDYADRLLSDQSKIDWSERVSIAQRNWIGKSEGMYIDFEIKDSEEKIKVFTTAVETIYGATFMVLSPEHPFVSMLEFPEKYRQDISEYIKKEQNQDGSLKKDKEKSGVFTGLFAINPMNRKEIPIWIANYVLMDYGTGAIMGVPAHDERDHQFAGNFDLSVIPVIAPSAEVAKKGRVSGDDYWDYSEIKARFNDDAILIDSDAFNGLTPREAKNAIMKDLEHANIGVRKSNYHLRDWLISRQRYWGPPIPMIHCVECESNGKSWFDTLEGREQAVLHKDQLDWNPAGWYPVPDDQLPVALPVIDDYKPKGEGKGPLADHPEFYEVACPECGAKAKRETDVSDVFVDSSWYYLRYPSLGSESEKTSPFDPEITKKWLPVDLYFGGAEHAVLHLMYSRFVTKVLYDLGYLTFDEPFPKFFAHGLMIKDGVKMSKSKGNVVNPDEYIEKFGADTLRLYLMFMGPMDGSPDFRDAGIEGMHRFVQKVWYLFSQSLNLSISDEDQKRIEVKMHKTIKRFITEVENFRYNTAISAVMEYVNLLREIGQKHVEQETPSSVLGTEVADDKSQMTNGKDPGWDEALKVLAQLLAPFAPHMTEELWVEYLDQPFSIHTSTFPTFDEKLTEDETVTMVVQVNGKLRANLTVQKDDATDKDKIVQMAREDDSVKKWIEDTEIKNEIFVPGKLVNFVV